MADRNALETNGSACKYLKVNKIYFSRTIAVFRDSKKKIVDFSKISKQMLALLYVINY